jgi:membrane protein DedA with SNARE-associated domain
MASPPPMWLPLGFQHWTPAAQILTLILFTFVQEDLPTVGSAILAAGGDMALGTALTGCFFGIWTGDALLYLLARAAGRPLLERKWARRFFDPVAVVRSERWFKERGFWLILTSRFVPGLRLPTYLAAGFLRAPFGWFLLVTGLVVAVWTLGIFILAHFFGPALVGWLTRLRYGAWVFLIGLVAVAILARLSVRVFRPAFRQRLHGRIGRWTRWEFWPPWLFYAPVFVNYVWLAIRHRGFMLPTAANPGIYAGGFVGESKIATLADLSAKCGEFTADAYLLTGATADERLAVLERLRAEHGIDFPFVLKPDVGARGVGVKVIRTAQQARAYLEQTGAKLVLQRYAPGPCEVGIFYYRFPDEAEGRIFAMTEKIFPVVVGDGRHTLEELIWSDRRARFMAAKYLKRLGTRRAEVPATGEPVRLVEAGNHAQGCIFQDGMRLWSRELEERIDEISRSLPGFYFGRYDVRYSSAKDLCLGRGFQIIELNGASSEATSIYDPRNTLWGAYRTLFRQWALAFEIGAANRRRGTRTARLGVLWKQWRESCAQSATLPVAD